MVDLFHNLGLGFNVVFQITWWSPSWLFGLSLPISIRSVRCWRTACAWVAYRRAIRDRKSAAWRCSSSMAAPIMIGMRVPSFLMNSFS